MTYTCKLDIKSMEKPTTLDAALECFEQMKEALAEFEDRVEEAESGTESANEAAGEAEDRADEAEGALECSLESLGRILQKLKAGRTGEAMADLDRALQEYDCGGRARMAAVAVML